MIITWEDSRGKVSIIAAREVVEKEIEKLLDRQVSFTVNFTPVDKDDKYE